MKKNPLTRYRGKILIGRIICVLIVLIVAGSLPIAVRAAIPVVSDFSKNGSEDSDITFSASDFETRFSDGDGDSLVKIQVTSLSSNGTLKLNGTPVTLNQEIVTADLNGLTFTPNSNWNGNTSIGWNGSDGIDYATTGALINITVNADPTDITLSNSSVNENELAGTVVGTFTTTDVDGGPTYTYSLVSGTGDTDNASFTIEVNTLKTAVSFDYETKNSYSIRVETDDSNGGTYEKQFTITVNNVNDPPVVTDFSKNGNEDSDIAFSASDFVNSFSDIDGDSLVKIQVTSLSISGILKLNGTPVILNQEIVSADLGGLTFTPNLNWNGNTNIGWNASDGSAYAATGASINITVNPVNDPPSFTKGTDQTVNEDAGAQSVAGWATAISPGPSNESSQTLTFQVSNDNTALFSSQPVFDATTGDLTYTPANNANGSTQVTVSLQDNGGTDNGGVDTSDLQYFNITVNPVNDPPVVTDFSKNGNEDSDIAFSASDFVNSYSDIDGDTLVKIQVTSLSISGTLKLNGAPVTLNQEIVYADLGGLTFTPKLNWHGTTSIGWNASDGNAYATIDALITITIQTVNDPPVADDDTYSTLEDKELIVDAKHGVLKSDVDPDGDNLTARLINNSVSNGTVNLDPDGSFRYIPEPNFNGPANFKYVANDGQADSNVATVTIKVGIENDPPNAQDDTATTPEDTPVAINVIANDFDVDGDMDVNTLSVFNPPIFGSTEVVQSSGIIMYTPDLNIHGVDHFEYEICDTVEECATATVTVTVTSVNDPPVAIKDTYYINITTKPPLIVQPPGVLSNDSDNDVEDELNAILVTNVNNEKQFTFNPDGSFEYSPRSGFNGIDGFTYKAFDGVLYSAVTQVGIVVDTESPTVEWISPVDNGSVLSVNGEVITLSVNATDKLGIERVNFYRWDAESTIFVIIGDVYSEPFTHDLNTNELNTGWNQIFAVSFDIAGNVSERQHIWLMREIPVNNTIYLPIVHSK